MSKEKEHNPYPHNEEAMKRMDEAQPTPTQEENDAAKVGPEEAEKVRKRKAAEDAKRDKDAEADNAKGNYKTRDAGRK